MDEAEAKVLIDFGGRNWIVWDADFKREKIGEMPTEMFFHFFKSFSDAAKANINIVVRERMNTIRSKPSLKPLQKPSKWL
jgi:imidazoleglycerol-phosphate dehydratase / histidinol-phosphatase